MFVERDHCTAHWAVQHPSMTELCLWAFSCRMARNKQRLKQSRQAAAASAAAKAGRQSNVPEAENRPGQSQPPDQQNSAQAQDDAAQAPPQQHGLQAEAQQDAPLAGAGSSVATSSHAIKSSKVHTPPPPSNPAQSPWGSQAAKVQVQGKHRSLA